MSPIALKWVFKVKRNKHNTVARHKARLITRGFIPREGIHFEEVFVLVARMESILLLLALVAAKDWHVHHMNMKSAFLNNELSEAVFIK